MQTDRSPENLAFVEAIGAMAPDRFAVVDGARFPDLSQTLIVANLRSLPLYLEQGVQGSMSLGPHLVPCGRPDDVFILERFLVALDRVVFWSWRYGERALYRHLRSINTVMVPSSLTNPGGRDMLGGSSVLFRHFDPRVLSAVAPVLRPEQRWRLIGQSSEIVFRDTMSGEVRRLTPPSPNSERPRAPLTFDPDQIAALFQRVEEPGQRRAMAFLRDAAPEQTAGLRDDELREVILASEQSGSRLGLASERAFGQWAMLYLLTGGEIEDAPDAAAAFESDEAQPDEIMSRLFEAICAGLDSAI